MQNSYVSIIRRIMGAVSIILGIRGKKKKEIPENNWKILEHNKLEPMHKLTNHNYDVSKK